MQIGDITLENNLFLAPMAGVTDKPFRNLCRQLGAGLAVSEMVTANTALWHTSKTRHRLDHKGEKVPCAVQIAGADPEMLANAARLNADAGAQIIDINMGCPAKKVCGVMAGSALLKDELIVKKILDAVIAAVDVPVTLKIRTGWDKRSRNAMKIAKLAEDSGIKMLTIHGRTRACGYKGNVEYETVKEIKSRISIPVVANGDIKTPFDAVKVLEETAVDGIMIGRAAQGNPWLFREIKYYLDHGEPPARPTMQEVGQIMLAHMRNLHTFYGEYTGVRVARKHIGWYCKQHGIKLFLQKVYKVESADEQLLVLEDFFSKQHEIEEEKAA
ncbi:MAG: tRNA dihydrouridine synthase DusB [Gammaproteobacteria bacterium]